MTSLIRQADLPIALPVQRLDLTSRGQLPGNGDQQADAVIPFARDTAASEQERELIELRRDMAANEAKHRHAVAAAREQGRKEAEEAYRRSETETCAALQKAIQSALQRIDEQLTATEALALLLCETALAKVLGNPKDYRGLVTQAIARQIAELRLETIVRVHVSPADFASQKTLDDLAQAIAAGRVNVLQDSQLPSGSCRIDLRLGQIEFSLPQHWAAIQNLLKDLARRDSAA